jgi:hypothetical protein
MKFESETALRRAYKKASPVDFTAEYPVGHNTIKERAPRGLKGARMPQADLFGAAQQTASYSHFLVECKQSFDLRGIGQLLFYDQLLRDDLTNSSCTDPRIERRLVLGSRPHSLAPLICSDLGISIEMPIQNAFQDITLTDDNTGDIQSNEESLPIWLNENQSPTLRTPAEEETLQTFLDAQLQDIDEETTYREIRVGNHQFSGVTSNFRADAIGHVPTTGHFYVIETKAEPDIGGLYKALGQAVTYASLFRQDWNLSPEQVIPTVLIDNAPWATDLYWETMDNSDYDTTAEMLINESAYNTDSVAVFCNRIARYQETRHN